MRTSALAYMLLSGFVLLDPTQLMSAQATASAAKVTVEDVLSLVQSGFSEEVIVTKIKKQGKAFDLRTEELVELRKAGISENIIKYLLDPSLPYVPPPPPSPPKDPEAAAPPVTPLPPRKEYPEDRYASKIPPELGLYYISAETPVKLDIKLLLAARDGAGIGAVLLKKGKSKAYLVGKKAKLRLHDPLPDFYMRLAEGKGIEEVVLMTTEIKGDRREVELGEGGAKPELKPEVIRPFEAVEVGPQLMRLRLSKLEAGEYLFFLMGSAEPAKGSQGKGYDFGVDRPVPEKK